MLLLELIIDPTSSVVFQRLKPDDNIMRTHPRKLNEPLQERKSVERLSNYPTISKEKKSTNKQEIEVNIKVAKNLGFGSFLQKLREDIVDILLDNNVPFSHEGIFELTNADNEVIASAAMIIDNPKIAIDPFDTNDSSVFEQNGYMVIAQEDFNEELIK